jgi:hypothetical protein
VRRGAFLCFVAVQGWAGVTLATESQAIPTYTNQDLDRLAPERGQTGVLSTRAPEGPVLPEIAQKRHGEDYWRQQAERLRSRLRPLKRRAEELRLRLREAQDAAWRSMPGKTRSSSASAQPERLAAELASVEAEIREREEELQDRARRERALPGWLR